MDDTQHQADAHDAAQPLTQSEYDELPADSTDTLESLNIEELPAPKLFDALEAWLESGDDAAGMTRELIAKDTSGCGLVRSAVRLAFYFGRMDGVAFAHGKHGAAWPVRP